MALPLINAAGIELIKRNEGCRLHAYQDSVGVWTIGYGDTGPDVVQGLTISQEEAERRLANRINKEFVPGVMKAIGDAHTTQNQLAAMVSLAYNVGVGAFGTSTVARKHAEGDAEGAAAAFARFNKAGGRVLAGLVRRRGEEAALYLRPDVAGAPPVTPPVKPGPVAPTKPTQPPRPPVDLSREIDAVKHIQATLFICGYYKGKIDGDWGSQTETALSNMLEKLGLEAG